MVSSQEYLQALSEGDETLVDLIFSNCFPVVRRFIERNNGKKEDAEDIFQKALLQIIIRFKKETFVINGSFETYLVVVCKNLWRRELNKSKNGLTDSDITNLSDAASDHAMALLEQKKQELFIEKLGLISENCKEILALYFARIPYSEIVNSTEYTSETVVRQRVFKCKKKLSELIKKDVRFLELKEP